MKSCIYVCAILACAFFTQEAYKIEIENDKEGYIETNSEAREDRYFFLFLNTIVRPIQYPRATQGRGY